MPRPVYASGSVRAVVVVPDEVTDKILAVVLAFLKNQVKRELRARGWLHLNTFRKPV